MHFVQFIYSVFLCYLSTTCRDHKILVASNYSVYAWQYCRSPPPPVSLEFLRVVRVIMMKKNIRMPKNTSQALKLYLPLIEE